MSPQRDDLQKKTLQLRDWWISPFLSVASGLGMRIGRREFLRRGLPVWAAVSLWGASFAEENVKEAKKPFKMAVGNAARTLRQAARQGGVDIVFLADIVKGVKTRAIKGDYTPSEAFALMLRDSTLVAVKHRKSGVYLIKKQESPDVNSAADHPNQE